MPLESYQKIVWNRNRYGIIRLLNKRPLSFKELIAESRLSRAVVNNHLASLRKEGIVIQSYENDKILNILRHSSLNLTEFFLGQLENLGVPKEVTEKGRVKLNDTILLFSSLAYIHFYDEIIDNYKKKEMNEPVQILATFKVPLFPSRRLRITRKLHAPLEEATDTEKFISEMTPTSLHMVMVLYSIEKMFLKSGVRLKSDSLTSVLRSKGNEQLKIGFDSAAQWWFDEVMEHIPSGGLLSILVLAHYQGKKSIFR